VDDADQLQRIVSRRSRVPTLGSGPLPGAGTAEGDAGTAQAREGGTA
jgi:hypothetical protein